MGRREREKGHQFERDVALQLRSVFPRARRQLEYQIEQCKGVDIAETGFYLFQCKKLKKYASINLIKEIEYSPLLGQVPILVTAGDKEIPMAVLPFEELVRLLDIERKCK